MPGMTRTSPPQHFSSMTRPPPLRHVFPAQQQFFSMVPPPPPPNYHREAGGPATASLYDEPYSDTWISYLTPLNATRPHRPGAKPTEKPEIYQGDPAKWRAWVASFYNCVHNTCLHVGEKLTILKRSLAPKIAMSVQPFLTGVDDYIAALQILQMDYGDLSEERRALRAHLRALPTPRAGDEEQLFEYATNVRCHILSLTRQPEPVTDDIKDAMTKFPLRDRSDWQDYVYSLSGGTSFQAGDFLDWVSRFISKRRIFRPTPAPLPPQRPGPKTSPLFPPPRGGPRANNHVADGRKEGKGGGEAKKQKDEDCPFCKKRGHRPAACYALKKMEPGEIFAIARAAHLCFTCLEQGHRVGSENCKKKEVLCGVDNCKRRHNPVLHGAPGPERNANPAGAEGEDEDHGASNNAATVGSYGMTSGERIAFGLLEVDVLVGNRIVRAKVAIDNMSSTTFMSEAFRKRAGIKVLKGQTVKGIVSGVAGGKGSYTMQRVQVKARPTQDGFEEQNFKAWTLPGNLTGKLASVDWSVEKNRYEHLKNLPMHKLADGNLPDILMGVDNGHLVIGSRQAEGKIGEPYAECTRLGWVIRGNVNADGKDDNKTRQVPHGAVHFCNVSYDFGALAERFFDGESFGTEFKQRHQDPKSQVWTNIAKGIKKLENEKGYAVELPWKEDVAPLQDNRKVAETRLQSLLRKLDRNPKERDEYETLLLRYVEDGYAKPVYTYDPTTSPKPDDPRCQPGQQYLPHHLVRKKKGRIVFDASATNNKDGLSMNQRLHVGPKLQVELPLVLTRWREYCIACVADIQAMFSRIRFLEKDAKCHQFLWRKLGERLIRVYRMLRVTFGDGPSPCLAIAVLHRVAEDFANEQPEVKDIILNSLYVDDLLHSCRTAGEASSRMGEVSEVLENADFYLRGWASNSAEFKPPGPHSEEERVKVLGHIWDTKEDTIEHQIPDLPKKTIFTKRELLSSLASLFSPLGLAAPFTVPAKIFLKMLHLYGVQWDDDISTKTEELYKEQINFWTSWLSELPLFCQRKFHRCLQPFSPDQILSTQLHAFGDASEEAFAAVVYLRTELTSGEVYVALVMAKTKVSPKKTISVAKLELNAALLAARLLRYLSEGLRIKPDARFLWTDSLCTRQWIRATSAFYKCYVSNRIGEIQDLTEPHEWRFVPGRLNVADLATRSALQEDWDTVFHRWGSGPDFLQQPPDKWPDDIGAERVKDEMRSKFEVIAVNNAARAEKEGLDLLQYSASSSLGRLLRSVIRVRRRCRIQQAKMKGLPMPVELWDPIEADELEEVMKSIIKAQQKEDFAMEIGMLQQEKPISELSRLRGLDPFIDKKGWLRVGGRLSRLRLPYDAKHPIVLLPGGLAKLIVNRLHLRHHHPGVNHLLSIVRQRYWILRGRELCKKVGSECRDCHRLRVRPLVQKMADLPEMRATTTPFSAVAVDMFGPIQIRLGTIRTDLRDKPRGPPRTEMRYGIIFTCMTTRAVFIAPAESASTAHFLNTLRMLEGLRGRPDVLYSDNGTNFVGAEAILRPVMEAWGRDQEFQDDLVSRGIRWVRYPPGAPHMGGVHEALIKSAKRALYRVMDREQRRRLLTETELTTLFFEVTGFLNNRPLTYVSNDPKDGVLTPNLLINARPIDIELPPAIQDLTPKRARDSYELVQALANEAWDVWLKEYLPSLMTRNKWRAAERNARVGDLMLVVDANLPRNSWRMGRVVQVHPDAKGFVRSVVVRLANGKMYHRPITRCCLLEAASDDIADRLEQEPEKITEVQDEKD